MSATTAIEWTNATYNPWSGCHKVSPGCAHCYAERLTERWGRDFSKVVRASERVFNSPLHWKKPRLVFACSMSDWFHEDADAWRDEAWDIVRRTPQHTYQILTKRPERMRGLGLPADWGDGYSNVWLGVSIENQRHIGRAGILAEIPARTRFLSCEPLLGPLTFRWAPWHPFARTRITDHLDGLRQYFHWMIAGGESGPEARPMNIEWAQTLRDQCQDAGVAFFMKQASGPRPGMRGNIPDDLWLKEMPQVPA